MAASNKYESTVRAPGKTKNQLAKSFWDFVKEDPAGNTFSPGYSGPVFLTQNHWNYIEIGKSAYSGDTPEPTNGQLRISPGKVDITVLKQYGRDLAKPVAKNNGVVIPQGVMIPSFDMKFTIWTAEQWGEFQDFVFQYVPTPRREPKSYTVIHPALQLHKITSVTIWGLDGPYDGPIPRSKVFIFKCTEFSPRQQENEVPAPDDIVYNKYYANEPASTMESSPGNTEAPTQPTGLNQ